jgi:hypothetical protein
MSDALKGDAAGLTPRVPASMGFFAFEIRQIVEFRARMHAQFSTF